MPKSGIKVTTDLSSLNKVQELDELAQTIASLKAAGKRVVLCHGVFDLLHVGHIRHFAEAKTEGDVLVVTVTEDAHVNKGPNRPAFSEHLRVEALAALREVDFVAISRYPTAVDVIRQLRPDVYAKGPDYKEAAADITGGITHEEQAATDVGGRIFFTRGETFSSSHLINEYISTYSPEVEEYLAAFRRRHSVEEIVGYLDTLKAMRVVVVGEAILDEYVYCDQLGKSSKDPVLAMRFLNSETYAGGSLAVANHVASFCGGVELVTYIGTQNAQEQFIRSNLKSNVRANFMYKSESPTIVKRRYVEKTWATKLFEVYFFNDEPLNDVEEDQFCELLEARLDRADCVIASDFGHGLITKKSMNLLADSGRFLAVNTQVNAANIRFHAISKYKRASYVCVNEGELRLDARSRKEPLAEVIGDLRKRLQFGAALVTRGKAGVSFFTDEDEVSSPAFTTNVVDRTGAGDAVLGITSLCVAAGFPPDVTAFIANVIGAQMVQVVGNRTSMDRVATIKFVQALLK